jgi:hypothetical protein
MSSTGTPLKRRLGSPVEFRSSKRLNRPIGEVKDGSGLRPSSLGMPPSSGSALGPSAIYTQLSYSSERERPSRAPASSTIHGSRPEASGSLASRGPFVPCQGPICESWYNLAPHGSRIEMNEGNNRCSAKYKIVNASDLGWKDTGEDWLAKVTKDRDEQLQKIQNLFPRVLETAKLKIDPIDRQVEEPSTNDLLIRPSEAGKLEPSDLREKFVSRRKKAREARVLERNKGDSCVLLMMMKIQRVIQERDSPNAQFWDSVERLLDEASKFYHRAFCEWPTFTDTGNRR